MEPVDVLIENVAVLLPGGDVLESGSVGVTGGRISAVGEEAVPAADIESALGAPLPSTDAQGLARTAPWFIGDDGEFDQELAAPQGKIGSHHVHGEKAAASSRTRPMVEPTLGYREHAGDVESDDHTKGHPDQRFRHEGKNQRRGGDHG